MAEMFFRDAQGNCRYGCYSERGLMSYYTFLILPTQLATFLSELRFPDRH